MQGQALLVTFAAIGKNDWLRAAIERAGGKRDAPFSRPFGRLRANGGVTQPPHPRLSLGQALTLSRLRERGLNQMPTLFATIPQKPENGGSSAIPTK